MKTIGGHVGELFKRRQSACAVKVAFKSNQIKFISDMHKIQ